MKPIRVKALTALLVILLSPPAWAEPVHGYAQFLTVQTLLWLPFYLDTSDPLERQVREVALHIQSQGLQQLVRRNSLQMPEADYELKPDSLIRFEAESSGLFNLPGRPVPRDAVTGVEVDSPIVFNLDRLSDPGRFTYEGAIRLWLHEIGHKLVLPLSPDERQAKIDELAARIAGYFGSQSSFEPPLFILNGSPFNKASAAFLMPMGAYLAARVPNRLVAINGGHLVDLTRSLNEALDHWQERGGFFETNRLITGVQWLEDQKPGLRHGLLELAVYRWPKNMDTGYLLTDLGGPNRHQAEFTLDLNLNPPQFKVSRYVHLEHRLQRADDARAELKDFTVSADGSVVATISFLLQTRENFHPAGYPVHTRAQLILYHDGQTLYLPVEIEANVDAAWSSMPAEIYNRQTIKRGRLRAQLPPEWRHEFQILGVADYFYILGPRGDYQTHRMLVQMETPLSIRPCEQWLTTTD